MKNLNLVFDLLFFPFLFLIEFFSQKEYSNKRIGKTIALFFALSLFTSVNVHADGNSNDSCTIAAPGELISELDNKSSVTSYTESGTYAKNGDRYDYYYFNINTAGTIAVDYTSNKKTDLSIGTGGCDDNKILNNGKSVSDSITVNIGDKVYIRVKREENKDGNYDIGLTFTPISTGCDNSLDTGSNDASPGVTIADMHNITTDTTDCISGSSESDDEDHYTFSVGIDGTLNIATSSPNGHDYYLKVSSDTQGDLYSTTAGENRSLSYSVSAGEIIYLRTKEKGSDTDWWQINLDFIATIVVETAPIMNPIGDQSTSENIAYSFDISTFVTQTDGDVISSYALSGGLPAGLTFNTNTGVISGTPTETGIFNLSVTATDDDGISNAESFSLTITSQTPPIMGDIPNQTATTSAAFSLNLSNFVTLTDGDPIITYTLTGTLPAGLSFDDITGAISGTPTTLGTYTLSATATDDDGVSNSDDFTITVTDTLVCVNYDTSSDNNDYYDVSVLDDDTDGDYANVLADVLADGYVVANMNNADTNTSACLYGSSPSGDYDYYYFTVDVDGRLDITGTSPNAHAYGLKVVSDNGSSYGTEKTDVHNLTIYLRAGDIVYLRVHEDGSDTDEYEIRFDFVTGVPLAGDRPFSIRNPPETRNLTGNYVIGGNMSLCEDDGTGNCRNSNSNDNDNDDIYVDIDGDASTKNSSSFELALPADSEVIWAGLYWQGVVHRSRSADGGDDFMGGTVPSNAPLLGGSTNQIDLTDNTYGADIVKLKLPGAGYVNITADQLDYSKLGYGGFANVTSLVNATNPNGVYMIADVKCHTGAEPDHGNYGAWALVVIYTNPDEEFRNVTVFDGFATVDSGYNEDLVIDGFLTPKITPINSKLAFFTMDGEGGSGGTLNVISDRLGGTKVFNAQNPVNSVFNSTVTGVNNRQPNYPPLRLDLDVFEMADILAPLETRAVLQPRSGGDRYTASFFIMSSELIEPKLCYDYAYQQNGRYFTEDNDGSKEPRIKGQLFSTDPISVSIYIDNREDSDVTIRDLKVTIDPIDTVQATYINNTVRATLPGQTRPQTVPVGSSGTSFVRDIEIGFVGSKEYFYTYYNIDPRRYRIDIPLNAKLDFISTIDVPGIGLVETAYEGLALGDKIPFCTDGNFSYAPIHSIFNVEQVAAGLGKYNLFTQVVRRVENFEVAAYDINDTDTPVNVSTIVAIELIDAGAYHEIETACQEPSTALTPRVWVVLDNEERTDFNHNTIQAAINAGSVSDQILNEATTMALAEDFFGTARRGVAFRMSYTNLGEGEGLVNLSPGRCQNSQTGPCYEVDNFPTLTGIDVGEGPGNCAADMDGNSNSEDKIPRYCGNSGARGLDSAALAVCMECIYGYNVHNICSRDNFAIRPEAFEISLSDDNTSTVVTDFANNTDNSGLTHLVAGYPYRFDINATNGQNTVTPTSTSPAPFNPNPVTGYVQTFDDSDPRKRAYMEWSPSGAVDCNVPDDRNMSFSMVDGTNTNPNPINTWGDRHDTLDNIGEYKFKVIDQEWTKHDWDPSLTRHQRGEFFIGFREQDCIKDNNDVGALNAKVGCETSSVHGNTHQEIDIKSHPFAFDVSGLSIGAGPTNTNNFVYINTLDQNLYPNGVDENMSYNIQGTFAAVSYTEDTLPNFTGGCYAHNVNMILMHAYRSTIPTDAPLNLVADLIDYNTTNTSLSYPNDDYTDRTRTQLSNDLTTINVTTGQALPQNSSMFVKDMKGAITMDLGFNFDRTYNTPLNPRNIRFSDFNISYATQPPELQVEGKDNHQIFGNRMLNQDITFAYARAKPFQDFYDDLKTNSILNPISIVTYCDLGLIECQDRGLANLATGLLIDSLSNESDWWYAQQHDVDSDGTVVLRTSGGGTITPASPDGIITTDGIDNTVTVTNTGGTPNIVAIDLIIKEAGVDAYTDRWVIYNKDADTVPSPLLRDRFTGDSSLSGWTGHGKTGHVVSDEINERKTRRLEW